MSNPTIAAPHIRHPNKVLRRFLRNRLGVAGLIIVLLLALTATFAPLLAPEDPAAQNLRARRAPPSAEFLLGGDEFGRDILSRLIYGARISLAISLLSVGFGLTVGSALGMLAGFHGGWLDTAIMRTMDLLLAFPYLLLAILIVSVLGSGTVNTTLAIGIWTTPAFARVARGSVTGLRDRDFIQAARSLGVRDPRILWRHLLPNIVATLLVYATLNLAYAVLMESALSFLGLGVQPPTPSWAGMIASGRTYITSAPHIATIPGIAIALTVLGFNLLGDGLRDALDPRMQGNEVP
jgi:peptide/nickel transport system permease protein